MGSMILHYDDVREEFYGGHTAQHQLQKSEIKVKKDCLYKLSFNIPQ